MVNVGPLDPSELDMTLENRPRPILDAANHIKAWVGLVAALLSAAGTGGILLSADQVSALQGILGALLPLITAFGVVLTAFGIVKRSEPLVTPMRDPRDNDGTKLVAIDGRPTAGGVLR